jgi:hypothetical protein
MDEKHAGPVFAALLGISFVVVSALVVVTRGHPYLVRRKLKIGALLLSISGVAAGCGPTTTCYVPALDYAVSLDPTSGGSGGIVVDLAVSDTLQGTFENRSGTEFSYQLRDTNGVVGSGDIYPADGVLDQPTERFRIVLGTSLAVGPYIIEFYAVNKDSINDAAPSDRHYPLQVIRSK